ncbi:MAG TPA: hypothetical protein VNK95_18305 [Caldilineaceae bacterium]|nr:hypothetical protein [Caldilineaceae bacterium]
MSRISSSPIALLVLVMLAILIVSCSTLESTSQSRTVLPPSPDVTAAIASQASPLIPSLSSNNPGNSPQVIPNSTIEDNVIVYKGTMPPEDRLQYTIQYDSDTWQYVEGEPLNRALTHQTIEDCQIGLYIVPEIADAIGTVQLGSHLWTVYETAAINSDIVYYSLPHGQDTFSIYLFLPAQFSFEDKGTCQREAEAVLSTFQIVTD